MISHEHKCIFIHIPKCAGTSIEAALGHLDGHVGRGGQDHRSIRRIEAPFLQPEILSGRENAMEALRRVRHRYRAHLNFRNKITVTRQQYETYFKFTIVRNPWTRAYSWYRNVIKNDVLKRELNIDGDIPFNLFLKKFAGKGMLRPQTYWLKNFKGAFPLDYVGRFENLSDDFRICCANMNVEPIDLPHRNNSRIANFDDAYDGESIDLVASVYKEEIELFGYSF